MTINAFTYRTACGVAAGDEVDVQIELDTEPRVVAVPADFAAALDQAGIRAVFDGMAYTHRKEWARSIEEAKSDATRRRRIDKAIDAVKAK